VQCRSCGTEIAEKALICYRCGTATSAPKIPPPDPRARGPLAVIVAILLIVLAAVGGVPLLPEGPLRLAGWGATVVATAAAVWLLKPSPGRRLRRKS
jgi:hypothetical protein